jgi:excinuclease ABC subunit C
MSKLEEKLKDLPTTPGVYFHKNSSGEIIYVGKAANLRNRVRQYFQKSRLRDPKTDALCVEIFDTDWTELETELDALFFEAEMVRRYMPQYNILLRDDKSFVYVRIDIKSNHPTVTTTRRPLDDGAEYLGPYMSKLAIAQALRLLRRAFPYSTHVPNAIPKRACLQAHLGLCPGLEGGMTSLEDYRKNLRQLIQYLKGNRKKLAVEIEKDMKRASKSRDYEAAAHLRNQLHALKSIDRQVIFGDRENMDISKDRALVGLMELLNLKNPPRRIEGFDISHMQGTDTVASMVVFVSGVPDKGQYRKFKSRVAGNDDFAHMREVMTRRFSEQNIKKWGLPNLILIDGGRGQASAALSILNALSIDIPLIGLAKRYEEIIVPKLIKPEQIATNSQITKVTFEILRLEESSDALKLLMRIRDESHRFAISYHTVLKRNRQTANQLETIPGIGPVTRKKLLKHFGSVKAILAAESSEVAAVIGPKLAQSITNLNP